MRILQYTFTICEGALFIPVRLLSLCNRLKEKINYKDRECTKVFVKLKDCIYYEFGVRVAAVINLVSITQFANEGE